MNTISICFIMKNEEKHLPSFLEAVGMNFKNIEYEFLGVDTGSTDDSLAIFKKYSEKYSDSKHAWRLEHFTWCNDFSAARNYMLSKCSHDFVLILDADEYVTNVDTNALYLFMKNHPHAIGLISRANHYEMNSTDSIYVDDVERFFSKNIYHYEGIIHEQVRPINPANCQSIRIPLSVDHAGYAGTPEEMQAKAQRNIDLLLEDLKRTPKDPYTLFQLGQAYNSVHDDENAYYYYGKGLEEDVDPALEYVQMMVIGYGYCMLHLGKNEEALSFEAIYDEFGNTADFVCLMGLIYLRNGQVMKAMAEFLKATSFETARTQGANSFIPLFNMGVINEVLGDTESAKTLYKKCGDFKPALDRLREL